MVTVFNGGLIQMKVKLCLLLVILSALCLLRADRPDAENQIINFLVGRKIDDIPFSRRQITSLETEARWLFAMDELISQSPVVRRSYKNENEVLSVLRESFSRVDKWNTVMIYYIEFDDKILLPEYPNLRRLICLVAVNDGVIVDVGISSYNLGDVKAGD
jgi:hypothetical protein